MAEMKHEWLKQAVLIGVLATAATQAPIAKSAVLELKPGEVAAFVARHPYAVVQATSPDRACGFCTGADKTFDQTAALKHRLPWVFARVQWSPWNKTPDFGDVMKVYGVPGQIVFRDGKVLGTIGGRPANAETLARNIADTVDKPVATRPASAPPARPSARAPAKPIDQALMRLLVREQFLEQAVKGCGRLHADSEAPLNARFQTWKSSHTAPREAASRQYLDAIAQDNRASLDQAIRTEKAAQQARFATELGVDWKKKPTEAECSKVVDKLTSLPVP